MTIVSNIRFHYGPPRRELPNSYSSEEGSLFSILMRLLRKTLFFDHDTWEATQYWFYNGSEPSPWWMRCVVRAAWPGTGLLLSEETDIGKVQPGERNITWYE